MPDLCRLFSGQRIKGIYVGRNKISVIEWIVGKLTITL